MSRVAGVPRRPVGAVGALEPGAALAQQHAGHAAAADAGAAQLGRDAAAAAVAHPAAHGAQGRGAAAARALAGAAPALGGVARPALAAAAAARAPPPAAREQGARHPGIHVPIPKIPAERSQTNRVVLKLRTYPPCDSAPSDSLTRAVLMFRFWFSSRGRSRREVRDAASRSSHAIMSIVSFGFCFLILFCFGSIID